MIPSCYKNKSILLFEIISTASNASEVIKIITTIARRNDRELESTSPFLAGLQGDLPLNCCAIHTQHLFVLLVPYIGH